MKRPVSFFVNAYKWDKEKQTLDFTEEKTNKSSPLYKRDHETFSEWIRSKDPQKLTRDTLKIFQGHRGCIPNFEIDFSDIFQVIRLLQFNHLPCMYKTGDDFKAEYEKAQERIRKEYPDSKDPKPCNAKCFVWGTYILRFDIDEMTPEGIDRLIEDLKLLGVGFLYTPSKSDGKEKILEDYDGDKDNLPPEVRPIKREDGREVYGITAARGHIYLFLDEPLDAESLVEYQTKLVYYFKTKYKPYMIRGFYDTCVDPAFSDDRSKSQCFFKIPTERVLEYYRQGRIIYNEGASILKKITLPDYIPESEGKKPIAAKKTAKTKSETYEDEAADPVRIDKTPYIQELIELGIIEDPLITFLNEKGHPIYEVTNDDGYLIQCPNCQQHTTGEDSMKYYPVGSVGHVWGGCSCFHSHCRPVGTETQRDRFFRDLKNLYPDDAARIDTVKKKCEQLVSDVPIVFPVEVSDERGSPIREYVKHGYTVPNPTILKNGGVNFNHNETAILSLLNAMIGKCELVLSRSSRTHAEILEIDGRASSQSVLVARVFLILEKFGNEYHTSKQTVELAIVHLIHDRETDPVYEKLMTRFEGKDWDGVNRLDTLLENYCHQIPHGIFTHDLYAAFTKYLFTGIWSRVMYAAGQYPHGKEPMTDIIPALVSRRAGIGKTRFLKAITYHDTSLQSQVKRSMIENADDVRDLFCCAGDSMLATLDDLVPFTPTLQEKFKALSSDDTGEFRELYTQRRTKFKRGFLYCVTTNETHFLKDFDEGVVRRWAAIELVQDFSSEEDMNRLSDDLDQIWLEAKALYEQNGKQTVFKPLEEILKRGEIARYFSFCDEMNEAIEIGCTEAIELYQQGNAKGTVKLYYEKPRDTFNQSDVSVRAEILKVLENMGQYRVRIPKDRVISVMARMGYEIRRTKKGIRYFSPINNQTRIIQLKNGA